MRFWNVLARKPNRLICSFRHFAANSCVEAFGQSFAVEWLGEETSRSRLQRSRANDLNGKSRDQNERHAMSPGRAGGLAVGHRSLFAFGHLQSRTTWSFLMARTESLCTAAA